MGAVMTKIKLTNTYDLLRLKRGHVRPEAVRSVEIEVLVDTGATTLVIPEGVADALGLDVIEHSRARLADGRFVETTRRGPVWLEVLGRGMTLDVTVVPECPQPLLGQIPLEHMAFVVDPRSGELRFDPANPDGHQYIYGASAA